MVRVSSDSTSPRWAPVLFLVGANLIPLIGAVFFDWSLFELVLIYWLENGIIGVFNLLKMAVAQGAPGSGMERVGVMGFFTMHYGLFWFVHGVFVIALFGAEAFGDTGGFASLSIASVLLATVSLIVSHGVSYVQNYLNGGERAEATPSGLMAQPYGRVIVLHLTILGGGFAVALFGSPVWALVVMVVLKIGVDLAAHLNEHRKAPQSLRAG